MCFAEPNMLNPQVFIVMKFRRFFWYVSPDETAFSRFKLRARLERSGFTDVLIRPFDWLHPRTPVPLIGAVQSLGQVLEKGPVVREFAASLLSCAYVPQIRVLGILRKIALFFAICDVVVSGNTISFAYGCLLTVITTAAVLYTQVSC